MPEAADIKEPSSPAPAFAGKYADEAEFEKGFRELNAQTGMFEVAADAPLVGDKGIFSSHKAMETGYKAMASALGRGLRAASKSAPAQNGEASGPLKIGEPESNELPDDADVSAVLKKAGLDPESVSAVYDRDGKLTDEMYAALRKIGMPKKVVNEVIGTTQTAKALVQEKIKGRATELAGGEPQLAALLAFAKSSLAPERVADLNRRLASPALFEGAIREISAEHQSAVGAGKARPLIGGQAANGSSSIATFDDFRKVRERAAGGDAGARAQIEAMPMDQFAKLCAI